MAWCPKPFDIDGLAKLSFSHSSAPPYSQWMKNNAHRHMFSSSVADRLAFATLPATVGTTGPVGTSAPEAEAVATNEIVRTTVTEI